MSTIEDLSLWYKARQDRVNAGADRLARRAWASFDSADPQAWAGSIPGMVRMVQAGMAASATGATDYVSRSLVMQGAEPDPVGEVNPSAFAETAADGRPLGSLLYMPALNVQARIDAGMSRTDAASAGLSDLLMIVGTEIADAGRQAVSAAQVADRRVTGYYRQPGPNACARCAILADKWFSTYEGASFERHPRCQCTAVPAAERHASNPAAPSPRSYFDGLSAQRQDAIFGKANAQAIRDGADPAAVINARRGVSGPGFSWTTTEGTTRRGVYGGYRTNSDGSLTKRAAGEKVKPRLTPTAIYRLSATREEAVQMLREYGYLL